MGDHGGAKVELADDGQVGVVVREDGTHVLLKFGPDNPGSYRGYLPVAKADLRPAAGGEGAT